jgi:hypothetical protein
MRQLHNQRRPFNLEAAEQIRRAGFEYKRFVAKDDCLELIVWQGENFVWRIAFNEQHRSITYGCETLPL